MDDHQDNFNSRERSRSRDRPTDNLGEDTRGDNEDGYEESNRDSGRSDHHHDDNNQRNDIEVHNLYVTNLSFQTTDESLRAAFEQFGEIHNVSVIKEPVTHTSRGFGFVSFIHLDDSTKAIESMNGGELDSRTIRVEKARRNTGYTKTPGVYLGPPQLSSRFVRDDSRGRDRGGPQYNDRRGGSFDNRDVRSYNGGGGGGGYRDDGRSGGGYRGGGGGGYDRPPGGFRDERYPDMQNQGIRGDPRGYNDYRGGSREQQQQPPRGYDSRRPPMSSGYDGGDRRGGGPGPYFDGNNRGRSPPRMDPGSFRRDRSRSPPPAMDDRRGGGGFDVRGGGPPPAAPSGGYGSGASAYFRGPPRY